MSEILRFDIDRLKENLSCMPSPHIAYFASSCAERLLPVIQTWRPDIANLCSAGIDTGWHYPQQDMTQTVHHRLAVLQATYEDVVKTVPNVYTITLPLTEHAVHSVICILQYTLSGDNKYAVLAGRCVINAVDVAVTWLTGIGKDGLYPQARISASPLIQQELEKQRTDLDKLRSPLIDAEMLHSLRLESQKLGQRLVEQIQQRLARKTASWQGARSRYEKNLEVEGYVQYFHPAGIVVKLDEETQGVFRFDDPNVDSQKHLLRAWTKITGKVTDYDEENQLVILGLLQIYAK